MPRRNHSGGKPSQAKHIAPSCTLRKPRLRVPQRSAQESPTGLSDVFQLDALAFPGLFPMRNTSQANDSSLLYSHLYHYRTILYDMNISERIQSRTSNLEKMSVRVAFHAAGRVARSHRCGESIHGVQGCNVSGLALRRIPWTTHHPLVAGSSPAGPTSWGQVEGSRSKVKDRRDHAVASMHFRTDQDR